MRSCKWFVFGLALVPVLSLAADTDQDSGS